VSAERLTDAELHLAKQYVRVLDLVSRCAQAIERGDWCSLYDKAAQLEDAAGRLATIAGDTWSEISGGTPRPRTDVMRAAVAYLGRHYRAARLLHPPAPNPRGVAW
jgi:hypothetical protein